MLSHGELTGRTLGRFRVGAQLGAGGMGVVYAAEDLSLGRKVALKLLPPALVADGVRRQRFWREAQSAAAVSHPNIATVHDIVEADGCTFIVMEHVEGQSLRALLAQGRMPLSQALELGATLAEAVASAHAAGVVHRDLKPENVMLDRTGRLKVLDFGIAKLETPGVAPTLTGGSITVEGVPIGTPGYMSPEQIRGAAVDHRTDVFALGVMLFELLTGHPPFGGHTPFDVAAATTRDEPPPLSSLDPRIPPRVAALVARCLAKDPSARPTTMLDVARELGQLRTELAALEMGQTVVPGTWNSEPALGSSPMAVAPTLVQTPIAAATPFAGAGTVPSTPTRKSSLPLFLALGGVGLLALVVAAGGAVLLGARAAAGPTSSAAPDIPGRGSDARLQEPAVGLAALDRFVGQRDSKGLAHDTAPAWEAAQSDFRRANQQRGTPARWRAGERFAQGRAALHRGRLDEAEQRFRGASELDPEWALPHVGLADVFQRRRDKDKALEAAQRAQQLDPKLWLGVREAARAYLLTNEFSSAISELRRALELSPKNALLLSELALAYHGAGMDDEATRHAELALAQDGDLVSAHILLAERALEAGRAKKALDHASRATSVQPTNVSAWLAKGDALALLDRRDEAKTAYQEALRLQKETKTTGAPQERLLAVEKALAAGTLPPPRSEDRSALSETRSRPTRSRPRSVPGAAPAPPRTKMNDSQY